MVDEKPAGSQVALDPQVLLIEVLLIQYWL
jgi:hypothetical protein